jgi:hypothetical protein
METKTTTSQYRNNNIGKLGDDYFKLTNEVNK